MDVRGLGYLGLETADLAGWTTFATEVLGLMVAPHSTDEVVQLKLDERAHRFTVVAGERDRLAYTGWEVADQATLAALAERLLAAGIELTPATDEELERRHVRAMHWCLDPSGMRVELFHTPVLDHVRFTSPAGVPRFVTDDLGMGHVVLLASDFEGSCAFYTDLLGFRLSDSMSLDGMPLRFLHTNGRHHSLALAPHHTSRLAHLMLEVPSVDDVGECLDRCLSHEVPVAQTLGRHTNDRMLSFYLRAPRGYEVEYGCQGRVIDVDGWATSEITAVSFWGHHRQG
ncbi:MAG: 2,3-dihydroxybiphenyl 1,2-dioxygenase [Actinomycetia bacterium]|nr:2,3-dihydroxybiphenyl 1,2-dioxygenase [Actinomycetes bacterium]